MADDASHLPGVRAKRSGNKYRNQPVEIDGVRFPSKKEAKRWGELKLLEKAGLISDLQRQVPFKLVVNGQLVATYIADAVYVESGERVVEDTKSEPTRKNATFRLKEKLLKACHGIQLRVV